MHYYCNAPAGAHSPLVRWRSPCNSMHRYNFLSFVIGSQNHEWCCNLLTLGLRQSSYFPSPLLYTSPPNFADRQNVDPAPKSQLRAAPSFCTQGGRPLCSPCVTVSQYPTIKLKVKCPHSKHNTIRSQPYKGSALSANKANSNDHIQYVLMDSGSKCRNT